MRTVDDITRDVEDELNWDPNIDPSDRGSGQGWRGNVVWFSHAASLPDGTRTALV
jgi:hypothetical protein